MATSGSVREKHSEEVVNFICSPCSVKKRSRRAESFCDTCNKYFCEHCLTYHDEIFTDHHQLGPEEFESKPPILLPTERCNLHGSKILEMYCKDHDKVVCNTCVSMQHRSCTAVVFIPSEVQNLMASPALAEVKADISTSLATLSGYEESKEVSLMKLREDRNAILETIESYGQKLKEIIDKIVEESKKEIEEEYQTTLSQLQEKLKKVDKSKEDFRHSVSQLEIAEKQKNDSQMFVSMKNCQVKMTESKTHHDDFSTWRETIKLEYEINKEIETSLRKFTSLGSVIRQNIKPSLYTVKGQKTVQVCQDATTCLIAGSCQIPDGSFLLTDFTHQKIVCLDSSCSRVTEQCPVPGQPYAVCLTGDNEAAVSLQGLQTIQFVSLGTKMALTRSVKLQHTCRGLAFSQGELFVSDNNCHVYVYDKAGTQLRTLGTITQGKGNVFNSTDHITVSKDGQRVFVANRGTGLVCVDRTGIEQFRYTDRQLQQAHGVCTDDRGSVFVCGYTSHNFIQLSEDGKMLGVLLQQSNGIRRPVSVCFDKKNQRLLVTKDCNSFVSVFDI